MSSFGQIYSNYSNRLNRFKSSNSSDLFNNSLYKIKEENMNNKNIKILREQIDILTDLVISYNRELEEIKTNLKNIYLPSKENAENVENVENVENIENIENIENVDTKKYKKFIYLMIFPFLSYVSYISYKKFIKK